ncbi:unnamed protein product, partial [Rotaria sp. Silwood2]
MSDDGNNQSIIELSCVNDSSRSTSMNNQLLFEKLDKIDEKAPHQVMKVKDHIQSALKMNLEEFKIVPPNKSQSRQYSVDWYLKFDEFYRKNHK